MKHFAGHYYHVYNRGANRQIIFANGDNYQFLLRRAREYLPHYSIRVVAYVLMPNHYHFLIGVDEDGALSSFFQRLFNSYSQAFNVQQSRTGTLFEGRAKSILIEDSSYVYALVRYIHLNPLIAGLVKDPVDWQFSNYQEWIGTRADELMFDPQFRDDFFSSPAEYKKYVLSDIPEAMERKLRKYCFD
jgi:putative transposase